MEELINYLHSIHPLSEGLREYLFSILRYKTIRRHDYLLRSGQVCRHIYFIQSGLLRCFYTKDNNEICSWFMKEGDVVVSVRSFFTQTESYEWIQALEDCTLHYISYSELIYAYKHFPEFNYTGRALLEKYYCLSEERLYSMRMQTTQQRYDYLLQHSPELFSRVPSKDIATYLGMRAETISRLKV
ncbi:MAG: Crp/Fnr family transcriptional regulator [Chitinophagaceae bacterium]